jgi:hypothetical protein
MCRHRLYTDEERKQRAREALKRYYYRMKADPISWEKYKAKQRRYINRKRKQDPAYREKEKDRLKHYEDSQRHLEEFQKRKREAKERHLNKMQLIKEVGFVRTDPRKSEELLKKYFPGL